MIVQVVRMKINNIQREKKYILENTKKSLVAITFISRSREIFVSIVLGSDMGAWPEKK